jgi:hypothetical protein
MRKRRKKASHRKSPLQTDMEAFVASSTVERTADYGQRGRFYRAVSDAQLNRLWQEIWKDLATDPLNHKKRSLQADLESEYALHGTACPWELVRKDVDHFLSESDRAWDKIWKRNPEAKAELNRLLELDLQKFRTSRSRSN